METLEKAIGSIYESTSVVPSFTHYDRKSALNPFGTNKATIVTTVSKEKANEISSYLKGSGMKTSEPSLVTGASYELMMKEFGKNTLDSIERTVNSYGAGRDDMQYSVASGSYRTTSGWTGGVDVYGAQITGEGKASDVIGLEESLFAHKAQNEHEGRLTIRTEGGDLIFKESGDGSY